MRQQEMVFRGRGGKRKGAGRKPAGEKAGASHKPRPEVKASQPMHITIRIASDIPALRTRAMYQLIRTVTADVTEREDQFRICHLSIQNEHLHLIVEAEDNHALARGMQSFGGSLATRINARLGRRGKVIADRYHLVVIRSPRQMRNVLEYVFGNYRKHGADKKLVAEWVIDPYSSAPQFDGWAEASWMTLWPPDVEPEWLVVTSAQSWLLREGWKRGGPPISVFGKPGPRPDWL